MHWSTLSKKLALLLGAGLIVCSWVIADASNGATKGSSLIRMKQFLAAAFPDVNRPGMDFTVREADAFAPSRNRRSYDFFVIPNSGCAAVTGSASFVASDGSKKEPCKDEMATKRPVLFGHFEVSRQEQIEAFYNGAYDPHSAELNRVRSLVHLHPEWSEADVGRAIKNEGGEFGPDKRDELHKDLGRLVAQLLGPRTTIKSFHFVTVSPAAFEGDNTPRVQLSWDVTLETVGSNGKAQSWSAEVEPLHGRLISLYKTA